MQYIIAIIIGIIVIGLVVVFIKYLLFKPKLNATITMLAMVVLGIYIIADGKPFVLVILCAIIIIDCLRDMVLAEQFYDTFEIDDDLSDMDKFYAVKSILSIFTLGTVRIIYLFIINPAIHRAAVKYVNSRMNVGHPLNKTGSSNIRTQYYYKKTINKYFAQGMLVSNESIVSKEIALRKSRLENMMPKKLAAKITQTVGDLFTKDKRLKILRDRAKESIERYEKGQCTAYISANHFSTFANEITAYMTDKSKVSAADIKNAPELARLKLNVPNRDDNSDWGEFFVIMALEGLVREGLYEDEILNDNDPLDTHVYHYVKSEKQPVSIDADSDPAFALDDDD